MIATHGYWCNAVTWNTKCPGCKEPVFFFHCNCGSKVFFDSLGHPWPIHDCEISWTRNLSRIRNGAGGVTVEIAPGITAQRAPEGSIHPDVATRARQRARQPDPIVAVLPVHHLDEVNVMGVLRERRVQVDVAQTLKLDGTSAMISGFLGPLGKGRWGKVTIHQPSPTEDTLHSYTAWVPSKTLSGVRGSTGVTVAATMFAHSMPGVETFWVCRHYEVLG